MFPDLTFWFLFMESSISECLIHVYLYEQVINPINSTKNIIFFRKQAWIPGHTGGGIEVSMPCWPVTLAVRVSYISWSGKRNIPWSKSLCKEWPNISNIISQKMNIYVFTLEMLLISTSLCQLCTNAPLIALFQ